MLILKILASRQDGRSSTAEITRDLVIVSGANLRAREIKGGIFQNGFVVIPSKGIWQITEAGRIYLETMDSMQ